MILRGIASYRKVCTAVGRQVEQSRSATLPLISGMDLRKKAGKTSIASKPEILDKDTIPMPDDFDIENYTKEVFFMFSGEKVLVDLRCDNSLMKTMVDRFGEDVTTLAYDMTSFRVQTEVSASPTFFGWVFGFNGKVQILAPESVKEQYRQMIAKSDEDMQESE